MRFVAIDFETANGRSDSACQVAAVVVRDAQIVIEQSWLIRPPRLYFSPRNIAIHGIRPRDVESAPSMEEVWRGLQPLVDGEVILAHNARFDLGVLVASLAAHEVACPDLEFSCTRTLARGAWPGRSRYGLKPLGEWLGINFKHHDALEDARCCAKVALAAAKTCEAENLDALEKTLQIRRGSYRQGMLKSPRQKLRRGSRHLELDGFDRNQADRYGFPLRSAAKRASVDPHTVIAAAAGTQPFRGRSMVFLGSLRGLSTTQTRELAEQLGATCQDTITRETDFVIACGGTLDEANRQITDAMVVRESTELNYLPSQRVAAIRLLSERQFLALLPAGKASTRW